MTTREFGMAIRSFLQEGHEPIRVSTGRCEVVKSDVEEDEHGKIISISETYSLMVGKVKTLAYWENPRLEENYIGIEIYTDRKEMSLDTARSAALNILTEFNKND